MRPLTGRRRAATPARRFARDRWRSRLSPRDLADEALAGIWRRPTRSALTALGTVLGVGAFVATLGLTTTASAQISGRFDALKATEVAVQDGRPEDPDPAFPRDVEEPLRRLNGVVAAGVLWAVDVGDVPVGRSPLAGLRERDTVPPVMASSPGTLTAVGASITQGRSYDRLHAERGEPVALLGAAVAQRLGIWSVREQPAIFIGGRAFTVLGIVGDVRSRTELLLSIIVPDRTAERVWGDQRAGPKTVIIRTELGAAQLIGRQAPLALRPQEPDRLVALVPPDPKALRHNVETDVNILFLVLAGVSLAIGALGIANTVLVSVLERTEEIGVRRALGAARRHVGAQFLAESAILGTVGGFVGAGTGVAIVAGVALIRHWTAVIEPILVVPAPLIGTVTGLLAGLYPAIKAAATQPLRALNR